MPSAKQTASEVFRSLDKDGNGTIDKDEYRAALMQMNIPKAITEVVTESVFAKFDTNKDEGIDEKEFVKYFSDSSSVNLHKRIYRAGFETKYTIVWGVYWCLVGLKCLLDTEGLLEGTFPGESKNAPALHMVTILGYSMLTGGLTVLAQRQLGVSPVFAYGCHAVFWSYLTVYENTVGSIMGASGFQEPPLVATALSIGVALYGIWSIHTERAKVKED